MNFLNCELLKRPENAIKVAGAQHTQKEVPLHTTSEMNARTASVLTELDPYICYAKMIKDGKVVKSRLISSKARKPSESSLSYWGGVLIPREQLSYLREVRTKKWMGGGYEPPPSSDPVS